MDVELARSEMQGEDSQDLEDEASEYLDAVRAADD